MSESSGLNIIFAGTPEFAARHLTALLASHHKVVAVYTQPDRPAGRGKQLQESAVKQVALAASLPVEQPIHLKDASTQNHLSSYHADVMVVVAYGLLLPAAVLAIPRLGCINVHGSILPRWRGAAPIQRAIEAGDQRTGITIMQMDVGLDTGAMLNVVECPISATDDAGTLHDRLAEIGPPTLLKTLDELATDRATPKAQDNQQATYAHKLTKEEAEIDWRQDAQTLCRRIRAFNPFPIAFTFLDGERIRIHSATIAPAQHNQPVGTIIDSHKRLVVACGNGSCLAIEVLQLPSKKALPIDVLLNSLATKLQPGKRLGVA
jgi:methionyl-tRNA formyltransferase